MTARGHTLRELAEMLDGAAEFWGLMFGGGGKQSGATRIPYTPAILEAMQAKVNP